MIIAKTTQSQLLAALQAVAGIIERRSPMPVLSNVLLRRTGGRCTRVRHHRRHTQSH